MLVATTFETLFGNKYLGHLLPNRGSNSHGFKKTILKCHFLTSSQSSLIVVRSISSPHVYAAIYLEDIRYTIPLKAPIPI
jgi:hypothetical protein